VDFVDVLEGLKPDGKVLINTTRSPEEMSAKLKRPVDVVDATQIAIDHGLGSREAPIVNTALLGAFARSSGIVSLDAVIQAIRNNVPRKKEENVAAARDAYVKVKIQEV
jgi:2-oxoacid:acceptor oxidoreductase gamma subunit (pyruvate/2-ketoisovalerate family)